MDYAEARAAFFQPAPETAAAPPEPTTPARRLRDALEPIATISFWSEPASVRYAERGLDFLLGYVYSRGCVLGEPAGPVVAAAFAVFEPGMIAGLYEQARQTCSLDDVRAAREAGAVEALRTVLGSPAGVADAVAVLRRGIDAADSTGRPLHAGLTALPWPTDPYAQLWHAATILREHRGDGHVAACVAAGLSGIEANLLTELAVGFDPTDYAATRGWSPEAMRAAADGLAARGLLHGDALTAAGRALRADLEARTDAAVAPAVEAIGADLDELVRTSNGWADAIIAHGWFPPDPRKRAAG